MVELLFFVYLMFKRLFILKKTIGYFALYFSFLLSYIAIAQQQPSINYTNTNDIIRVGKYLNTLEDTSGKLTINDVDKLNTFIPSTNDIPNFGITKSTYWAKFSINNNTDVEDFILEFEKITAQELVLYYKTHPTDSNYVIQNSNNNSKKYSGQLFLFDFKVPKKESVTLYVKFKTNWGATFPIKISTRDRILHQLFNDELIKGIYLGILFIMVFYNMFIYFSIREKSYFFYVIYIFSFLLFQFNELGYAYKYFWVAKPHLFDMASKLLPNLTCLTAVLFVRDYLKTKKYTPKLDKFYNFAIILLILSFAFPFIKESNNAFFTFINVTTLVISLYTLLIAIIILRKGFQPAKYFLIAWSILLFSIIQFNLSNLGFIPYYPITDHSLEIGSVIEVFLLSLGLAYRINVLKKEKEISQERTINLIEEKKSIIENQNLVLEKLVYERTQKLELRNKIISEKNEEKSIMMREIHHRVKNNLQMINSMVRLQSRYLDKENASDSLKEVERRILTMSLLHEKMYQSDNLVSINIKEYITAVMSDLSYIFDSKKNVKYTLNIDDIKFKTETILYIGLLVNELITNSLKHAFNEQDNGLLHISLFQKNINEYTLNVTNNGVEINFDKLNNSDSLGQRLIRNFVKQLHGKLTIESNKNETSFIVQFTEN